MYYHESIGLNILVIDKYFKIYLKKSLKEYNLNTSEGLVLLILYKQLETLDKNLIEIHNTELGKTQDQIIDELHYDKGVMTRAMKSLEEKNYVLRKDNPQDNRSYIFELTEEAICLKPHLLEILNKWHNIVLKDINKDMIKILKSQLSKMFQNVINSNKI